MATYELNKGSAAARRSSMGAPSFRAKALASSTCPSRTLRRFFASCGVVTGYLPPGSRWSADREREEVEDRRSSEVNMAEGDHEVALAGKIKV
ncbi:hypothetical protein ACIBHY_09490 [Nonomuraea sp. NPDC050547]|uniref:hypothetical protein n=1 Tax=Nonomuraea sp. NPDC050547 TaxID=3364368 RepID=UPI00378E6730